MLPETDIRFAVRPHCFGHAKQYVSTVFDLLGENEALFSGDFQLIGGMKQPSNLSRSGRSGNARWHRRARRQPARQRLPGFARNAGQRFEPVYILRCDPDPAAERCTIFRRQVLGRCGSNDGAAPAQEITQRFGGDAKNSPASRLDHRRKHVEAPKHFAGTPRMGCRGMSRIAGRQNRPARANGRPPRCQPRPPAIRPCAERLSLSPISSAGLCFIASVRRNRGTRPLPHLCSAAPTRYCAPSKGIAFQPVPQSSITETWSRPMPSGSSRARNRL